MRKHKITRNLIILGIFALVGLFGSFLCEAQTKTNVPAASQRPPKRPRIIPFSVRGHVFKDGKGVKNVRVMLVPIQRLTRLKRFRAIAPSAVTDKNGRYSFSIDPKKEGRNYKLVPKHPAFPAGKHFMPWEKKFILTKSLTVNFKFQPPKYIVKGISKTATNRELYRTEMRLHRVVGPHQYKYITTLKGSTCKFELDYDFHGKKFRLQPRHLQMGVFGVGFTPKESRFTLTGDRQENFVYNGPLPDLIVAGVRRSSSYIIITLKNQGKLGAGKHKLLLGYNTYDKTTGANPYTKVERPISGLAAGASTELHFFKPVPATKRISISLIRADYGNRVVESDERNNKWGK